MQAAEAPFFADLADGPPGGRAFWARAADGPRLRLGHWPAAPETPQGDARTLLLFPGRTEYIEKYGRVAREFTARGYHVLAIDWRGQGLSDRALEDPMPGHVGDFAEYQRDIDAMLDLADALSLPGPRLLLAHSMGGCIGLRALMRGLDVQAAAFSAPMWGIRLSPGMRPAAWAMAWASARTGRGGLMAPGTSPEAYPLVAPFDDNLLTRDAESYAWMRAHLEARPELRLGGPSLSWLLAGLKECRSLNALPAPPVPCATWLGTSERIVDAERVRRRMARWPNGHLHMVPGAEHEVLMESPDQRAQIVEAMDAHFRAGAEGLQGASAGRAARG